MPHWTPTSKSPKGPAHDSRTGFAAGSNGVALMPPASGIEFIDRIPAGEGPLQLMPCLDHRRGGLENRTGLPDHVKAGIESISGFDLSDVRVHFNSSKPASLQALAYTQGSDIHVAPGQERHLPHEAWHVVQQKQGRVRPMFQLKGEQINDDQGLEQEAEVMGAKMLVQSAQLTSGPEENRFLKRKLEKHVTPMQFETANATVEKRSMMPYSLTAEFGHLSGLDQLDAQENYNSNGPVQLNTLPYTQSQDIEVRLRRGRHLPHEGWHARQHMQGPVQPMMQAKGVSINNKSVLGREVDGMRAKALQITSSDQVMANPASAQLRKRAESPFFVSQSPVVQCRGLSRKEREDLADAKDRLARLQKRYETHKELMTNALTKRGGFANVLGYFQDLGWIHATQEVTKLDAVFTDLDDLSRRAANNHKSCSEFIAKVNSYDKSGGMNQFYNIYTDIEKGLLSNERDYTNQFTELDEAYFRKYLEAGKSAITVYRGDGRAVTSASFDTLPFSDMPAGGTPDITFAGVVEHTHTNTLKNGMVSCTTDPDVAHYFATKDHQYGVVWELKLDNYIHVTNLLKARNFRYRFPGQFEVLYPGKIPGSKIVSATLYQKDLLIKTRTRK